MLGQALHHQRIDRSLTCGPPISRKLIRGESPPRAGLLDSRFVRRDDGEEDPPQARMARSGATALKLFLRVWWHDLHVVASDHDVSRGVRFTDLWWAQQLSATLAAPTSGNPRPRMSGMGDKMVPRSRADSVKPPGLLSRQPIASARCPRRKTRPTGQRWGTDGTEDVVNPDLAKRVPENPIDPTRGLRPSDSPTECSRWWTRNNGPRR